MKYRVVVDDPELDREYELEVAAPDLESALTEASRQALTQARIKGWPGAEELAIADVRPYAMLSAEMATIRGAKAR